MRRGIIAFLLMLPGVLFAADAEHAHISQELQSSIEQTASESGAPEGAAVSVTSFEIQELPTGNVKLEAEIKLVYGRETKLIPVSGYGADQEHALQDMKEYVRRLLPYEFVQFSEWDQPRIEHITNRQVFIFSEEPVLRGGTEFKAVDREGSVRGLVRVKSLRYWDRIPESQLESAEAALWRLNTESDPWHHYLPVDAVYAAGPMKPGMQLEPFNRAGVSLSVRSGVELFPTTEYPFFVSTVASFDSLFECWYPFVRFDRTITGHMEEKNYILAGWGFSFTIGRRADQAKGVFSRLEAHAMFAGGIGSDVFTFEDFSLAYGTSGFVRMYLSPRWSLETFGEIQVIIPDRENLAINYNTVNLGLGVTFRL